MPALRVAGYESSRVDPCDPAAGTEYAGWRAGHQELKGQTLGPCAKLSLAPAAASDRSLDSNTWMDELVTLKVGQ